MSLPVETLKDLTSRGYSMEEARDIVGRALRIVATDDRAWNCNRDLCASRSSWVLAYEDARDEHIIEGFRSGYYRFSS